MKEQYVGDINDYRKYALLRVLAAGGRHRVGVCWMMTPSDGSADGNVLSYLTKPERFRAFDSDLFDLLRSTVNDVGGRRLSAIEAGEAIPSATYYNAQLPREREARSAYWRNCLASFRDRDLVFLDPDNGLAVASTAKGRKNSDKYIFLDEVAAFYTAGQSLLIYQHYPRIDRVSFAAACASSLRAIASDAEVWRFSTAHVLFLLLLRPDAPASFMIAVKEAASRWPAAFIHGAKMTPARGKAGP
ncbi:hypothetical protein [Methylopila sp. Yamaguchi]|uniref:hypothetical protein n=1 Tax=Methylopila sp. Yamaguchi TaxID=1437817 RepID=UPI000CB88C74|nr:hypothetical protein [Methylopila sp. Yamaguchi]GBD47027.1 hypothetical protein METY_0240 [Methylopila sp. Yamaguchi]